MLVLEAVLNVLWTNESVYSGVRLTKIGFFIDLASSLWWVRPPGADLAPSSYSGLGMGCRRKAGAR